MSQSIVMALTTFNAMLFMLMKHPMSTGIVLMAHTILVCFLTNNAARDAWFSYILFLVFLGGMLVFSYILFMVFLGGMLVLFIYLTSVASNELFNMPSYSCILVLPILMLMMMIMDPILLTNNSEESVILEKKEIITTTMMFNYPYNFMTIAVITYLFLTLIVVVKITESHVGPLRSSD
uniref:NADH-ubiquinone oxidoreductase chain 6 n=1 Tax=Atrocalopteryx atrata TaxID=193161 RepID=A0A0F7J3S9_9ODON|nr:NADH dehydrogenase subunit 6 [Atrocalopteryx atrata]AKH04381.1 NADH dehydrogenase subunit 6 [Atrocalopteryx atrata]